MFNKSTLFSRNDATRRAAAATPNSAESSVGSSALSSTGSEAVVTSRSQQSGVARSSGISQATSSINSVTNLQRQTSPSVTSNMNTTTMTTSTTTDNASKTQNAPEVMGARLIVGPEVKLKGAEIQDCDTLVVEGRVEATMDSRVIRIAEQGAFIGKVSIDIAEIHGTFEGELTARSQLVIHSTGRVSGTIRYGKLVADEGCELCGDVSTIKNATVRVPVVSVSSSDDAEENEPAVAFGS